MKYRQKAWQPHGSASASPARSTLSPGDGGSLAQTWSFAVYFNLTPINGIAGFGTRWASLMMALRVEKDERNRSSVIKIVIAVVALSAAGGYTYYNWSNSGRVEQPDTAESASVFACLECGHVFELTPAAYVRLKERGDIEVTNANEGRGRRWVRCPKCQKFTATLADRCPNDGTAVPRYGRDNKTGRCPKCRWTSIGA